MRHARMCTAAPGRAYVTLAVRLYGRARRARARARRGSHRAARCSRGGAGLALGGDLQAAAINLVALATLGGRRLKAFAARCARRRAVQEWAAWGGRAVRRVGLERAGAQRGPARLPRRERPAGGRGGASSTALKACSSRVRWRAGSKSAAPRGGVGERIGGDVGLGLTFDAGALVHAGLLHVAPAGQNFGGSMNWGGRGAGAWREPGRRRRAGPRRERLRVAPT